jgi:C4-dicarboxylate transporter DctM subunit
MSAIVVLLGGFIFLLAINVPVAFSMVLACIAAFFWQSSIPMSTVTMKLYSGIDTFPFLAIPLFILAGGLMEQGGISQGLVRLASNLVGHIRGGLGFVVVVAEIFFSGISGSSIADASAMPSGRGWCYSSPRSSNCDRRRHGTVTYPVGSCNDRPDPEGVQGEGRPWPS